MHFSKKKVNREKAKIGNYFWYVKDRKMFFRNISLGLA